MSDIPLFVWFAILAGLILLSAFFSSSETSMMALNRYRVKHLKKIGHKGATRAHKLLETPDKLIGVILIGNNFVNILASSIATLIAISLYGEAGIPIATVAMTIIILIFAEVTPKTYAAVKPETIAFPASFILQGLLFVLHPVVRWTNHLSNRLLKYFGVVSLESTNDQLSAEELRTLVNESSPLIPRRHQKMLASILDLEHVCVEDIMIPRSEVFAIDLDDDMDEILHMLSSTQHTRIPVYKGSLNEPVAFLHARKWAKFLNSAEEKNKANLMQYTVEPYFTFIGTSLHAQLAQFQKKKRRVALVVDEYGDVQGLVTLEDILEEIVGDFTTDLSSAVNPDIWPQTDGSFIVSGSATIRELNKVLGTPLSTDGPKTLSGLIVEQLETIPSNGTSFKVHDWVIETLRVKENLVKTALLRKVSSTAKHQE